MSYPFVLTVLILAKEGDTKTGRQGIEFQEIIFGQNWISAMGARKRNFIWPSFSTAGRHYTLLLVLDFKNSEFR